MKEMWETPRIAVQMFAADEYVSACYDYKAQLQCAIPGSWWDRNHEHYIGSDNSTASSNHGSCGTMTEEFDVFGSVGYETRNGEVNYQRPIYDITIGEKIEDTSNLSGIYFGEDPGSYSGDLTDGWYKATWWSEDLENGTGKYFHWGLAVISSVIQIFGRPNHS